MDGVLLKADSCCDVFIRFGVVGFRVWCIGCLCL